MSVAWVMFVGFGAVGVALLLWLAWTWLARSWEVLDDDQLSEKLSSPVGRSPRLWLRMRSWFERGPRRLTYRRDERGRFRRIRR